MCCSSNWLMKSPFIVSNTRASVAFSAVLTQPNEGIFCYRDSKNHDKPSLFDTVAIMPTVSQCFNKITNLT